MNSPIYPKWYLSFPFSHRFLSYSAKRKMNNSMEKAGKSRNKCQKWEQGTSSTNSRPPAISRPPCSPLCFNNYCSYIGRTVRLTSIWFCTISAARKYLWKIWKVLWKNAVWMKEKNKTVIMVSERAERQNWIFIGYWVGVYQFTALAARLPVRKMVLKSFDLKVIWLTTITLLNLIEI